MLALALSTNQSINLSICSDSIDSALERFNLQRVSLLRQFCLKVGIQILLKEYNLDTKHKQVFYEDDIINVFPIVKNVHPKVCIING
jgi:protein TIF31